MIRRLLSLLLAAGIVLTPSAGQAQSTATCPEFEGITCDGFVTDRAGVIENDEVLEAEAARIEGLYGSQVAVVIVPSVGSWSIERFAQELGNTWGVGSAESDNGIVVIVDVGGRETWVEFGDGLKDFPRGKTQMANLGDAGFRNSDFDAGVLAILSGLDEGLEAFANGERSQGTNWGLIGGVIGIIALGLVGAGVMRMRNQNQKRVRRHRAELVDGQLDRLDVAGHELPLISEYAAPRPDVAGDTSTIAVVDALDSISRGEAPNDADAVASAWSLGMVDMIDRSRLLSDTEIPLELQASGERDITDEAVLADYHVK